MSDNRTVRSAFLEKPDERRKAVRPQLRLMDYIKYDLIPMGVKSGRYRVEYRFV